MKEKTSEKIKSKPSKKKMIILSSVAVVTIALGVAAGTIIGKLVFVPEVDYSNIDINSLEDDQVKLMKRYESSSTSSIDEFISKFKPYELVNISLNKIGQHQYVRGVGKGLVTANVSGIKVNQEIRSNNVKVGTDLFSESISASSMVKVAKRFYQDKTSVKYYDGKYKEIESCEFSEKSLKGTFSIEQFDEEWGRDFTRPTIYIISSKTIKEAKANKLEDKITISLELDPFTSVARYVKQMRMTSDLKKDPNFSKVHIDFTLDKNLNLLENTINETYKTYYAGVWADTSGTLTEVKHYDEESLVIPSLSEDSNYN